MVADRYGRKPVAILGIISVIIFNTIFGLSTSFWMAVISRFFLGSLNGLLGPMKAYCSEIFREEKQALGLSTEELYAIEGGCFVLSANQFCRRKDYPPPPEYVFAGVEEDLKPDSVVCAEGSVIVSPSGAVLAGLNCEGEALISADLDLGEIATAKFDFDVVGHYSRPEVLSLIVRDHPTNPVTFASTTTETEEKTK